MSIVYVNTIAPNTGDTVSVSGSLFVSGNINLGDANTDGINFNADVDSHIIPNSASIYNLGSSSRGWNNVYANNFYGTASLATAVSGTSIVGTTGSFGEVSASSIRGLLVTQNQTNITSLGTLSGLNVYGPLSASDGHGLYVSHNINAGGVIQANKITTTGSTGLVVNNSASIGHLTVDGEISSSGTASLGSILLPYQGKIFVEDHTGNTNDVFFHNLADGGLFVGDSDTKLVLTASNAAGGVTTSTGTKFTTNFDVRLGNSASYHNIDIVGNLHLNNNSIDEVTHITASGIYSGSGTRLTGTGSMNRLAVGTLSNTHKQIDIGSPAGTFGMFHSASINLAGSGSFKYLKVDGNISASGTVFADNFESVGGDDTISFTDDLKITGHITASGGISSSNVNSTGTGSFAQGLILGNGSISSSTGVINADELLLASSASAESINVGGPTYMHRKNIHFGGATSNVYAQSFFSASINLHGSGSFKYLKTDGQISSSGNLTANTGSFLGGLNLGTATYGGFGADNIQLYAPNTDITAKTVSASGDVTANSLTLRFTEGVSQDLASSAFYAVNGSKVKVKAITAANINDGAFAEFSLVNSSIQDDSVIMCNFVAGCANNISSSILTAAVSKSGAARVFIHNETGATINADTAFTASFVIL